MEYLIKRTSFRIVFCLTLVVVLLLALLPAQDVKSIGFSYDKLNHFLAFFVLCFLARSAWPRLYFIWPALGLLIVGMGIEVGQYFIGHGRDASWGDIAADAVGIIMALLFWGCWRWWLRKRRSSFLVAS
jgi:VanZ family protein